MTAYLRRIAAWFSHDAALRRAEQRELAHLERYLSTASSLAELENMQRNWDRKRRDGSPFVFSH